MQLINPHNRYKVDKAEEAAEAINLVLKHFNLDPSQRGMKLTFGGTLTCVSGTGASAAQVVALSRAISLWLPKELTEDEVRSVARCSPHTLGYTPTHTLVVVVVHCRHSVLSAGDTGCTVHTVLLCLVLFIGRALCACLLAAVCSQINAAGYEGEKGYHGTPSGIDNTAATFGGVLRFQRTEGAPIFITKQLAEPIRIVFASTGITSSTTKVGAPRGTVWRFPNCLLYTSPSPRDRG